MARAALTILGEPASKANSRKAAIIRGKQRFIKSEKALAYVQDVIKQTPVRRPMLKGDLCFIAHLYYATRRPDLDESLLLDALQGRLYKNDRQIKEKHIYHNIDAERPRAEIVVEEIDD